MGRNTSVLLLLLLLRRKKKRTRQERRRRKKYIYIPSGYIDREKVLAVIILSGRWRINDPPTPSSSSPAKLAAL
jgi:hypothetical protein